MSEELPVVISRSEAKAAGLKWCWWHKCHEPISGFGLSAGRPDGLQPLCRLAKNEQEKQRRSRRDGYEPRVCDEVRSSAPEGTKWCNHHNGFCKTDDFSPDGRHSDGRQSSCRRAQSEMKGRTTNKASKYNPAPIGAKWCWFHKAFEPLDTFNDAEIRHRDKSGKVGMCRTAQTEYCQLHMGRFLAHVHKRRARKRQAGGTYTAADIGGIFKEQGGKCAYCRKSIKVRYHIDHIMPLALGGSNWPRNLQLLCQPCNSKKAAKHPIIFAQQMGRLV